MLAIFSSLDEIPPFFPQSFLSATVELLNGVFQVNEEFFKTGNGGHRPSSKANFQSNVHSLISVQQQSDFQYRLGFKTLHSTLTALLDVNDSCCSNTDDIMINIV